MTRMFNKIYSLIHFGVGACSMLYGILNQDYTLMVLGSIAMYQTQTQSPCHQNTEKKKTCHCAE